MPDHSLVEFLRREDVGLAGKEAQVAEALGVDSLEEILTLVNQREDLQDLDDAKDNNGAKLFKRLHINKLFSALLAEKGRLAATAEAAVGAAESPSAVTSSQNGPVSAKEMVAEGSSLPQTSREAVCVILDARNIAKARANGRECVFENTRQLRTAYDWFEHRWPQCPVRIYLYADVAERWRSDTHLQGIAKSLHPTPAGEDVDKFLIRSARQGLDSMSVRIVTNDRFRNFIGAELEGLVITDEWVEQHVIKYMFADDNFLPNFEGKEDHQKLPRPAPPLIPERQGSDHGGDLEEARVSLCVVGPKGKDAQQILLSAKSPCALHCPGRRCALQLAIIQGPKSGSASWVLECRGLDAPAERAATQVTVSGDRPAKELCPTCGSYFELSFVQGPRACAVVPQSHASAPLTARCAIVSVLWAGEEGLAERYCLDALVLAHSLDRVGSSLDRLLLHTTEEAVLREPTLRLLPLLGWRLVPVEPIATVAGLTSRCRERFKGAFNKLHALSLCEYDRVVVLDLDVLVRGEGIDELADEERFPAPTAVARVNGSNRLLRPGEQLDPEGLFGEDGMQCYGINSGVMVLKPNMKTFKDMRKSVENPADRSHIASAGPEQDFLTRWPEFWRQWRHLDPRYNYQLHQLSFAARDTARHGSDRRRVPLDEVKVFHYSAERKPHEFYWPDKDCSWQSFGDFVRMKLVPSNAEAWVQEAVERSAVEWHEAALSMWQSLANGKLKVHDLLRSGLPEELQPLWRALVEAEGTAGAKEVKEPTGLPKLSPATLRAGVSFLEAVHKLRDGEHRETGSIHRTLEHALEVGQVAERLPEHAAAAPPSPPSDVAVQLGRLPLRQLKDLLSEHCVDFTGCLEKRDLVAAALRSPALVCSWEPAGEGPPVPPVPPVPSSASEEQGKQGAKAEGPTEVRAAAAAPPVDVARLRNSELKDLLRATGREADIRTCRERDDLVAAVQRILNLPGCLSELHQRPPLQLASGSGADVGMCREKEACPASATGRLRSSQPRKNRARTAVEERREEIMAAIEKHNVTIIVASTGSGKSTGIPRMIMEDFEHARVAVTQPRRIAAVSLAKCVAKELDPTSKVGEKVGFLIGGYHEADSTRTPLVYMTTALAMLQLLQGDCGYTHLVVDEVHERSVFIDIILTMVKSRLLPTQGNVKVVLMSAAMDAEKLRRYFEDRSNGRTAHVLDLQIERKHRLTIEHLDEIAFFRNHKLKVSKATSSLIAEFVECLDQRYNCCENFLVFLPGKPDVREVYEKLMQGPGRYGGIIVHQIYGGMSVEVQERLLRCSHGYRCRSVLLATDVVESSVTIPEVTVVIDTCEHKRRRWDQYRKESPLVVEYISKDEAKQRAGRVGRTKAGTAYRLVSKRDFDQFREHATPQIKSDNLEEMLLTLHEHTASRDPLRFLKEMPEPPDTMRVQDCMVRFHELNALRDDGSGRRLTHFGRFLKCLPLDPDVGNLVMNGLRYGVLDDCVVLAAVHQRGDPFLEDPCRSPEQAFSLRAVRATCCLGLPSDLLAGLLAYRAWKRKLEEKDIRSWPVMEEIQWCAEHFLSLAKLHELEELRLQIFDALEKNGFDAGASADREQMRRRRRQLPDGDAAVDLVQWQPGGGSNPAAEFERLLQTQLHDVQKQQLLQWCIAAAFTHGILETEGLGRGLDVRVEPWREDNDGSGRGVVPAKEDLKEWSKQFFRQQGLGVHSSRFAHRGDVFLKFDTDEHARVAIQAGQLMGTSVELPFRRISKARSVDAIKPRKCYQDAECKVGMTSLAALPVRDLATIVSAEFLPIQDATSGKVFYLCTKCSEVPHGILPLVIIATYHEARLKDEGDQLVVRAKFRGKLEEMRFRKPHDCEVLDLVKSIRSQMDSEFGGPNRSLAAPSEHRCMVAERQRQVLKLMDKLSSFHEPPMATVRAFQSLPRGLWTGLGSLECDREDWDDEWLDLDDVLDD